MVQTNRKMFFYKVVKFQIFRHLGFLLRPMAHFLLAASSTSLFLDWKERFHDFAVSFLHLSWLGWHVLQLWTTTHIGFCENQTAWTNSWSDKVVFQVPDPSFKIWWFMACGGSKQSHCVCFWDWRAKLACGKPVESSGWESRPTEQRDSVALATCQNSRYHHCHVIRKHNQ